VTKRDPKRIKRLLKHLERYWLARPDLRLAQIVVNAADMGATLRTNRAATANDIFVLEDDELELRLQRLEEKYPA
jgi:uncharacterized protein YihD (DUF1040 family)